MRHEDGSSRQMHGTYAVGCDGARSVVRKQAGIAFEGHAPTFTGIVADVVIDNPWPEGRHIIGNDRGWLASSACQGPPRTTAGARSQCRVVAT
jgi:2-polyprenyl-6-methoxyphenol hydroxylase-like FAD-dependent oxidoreductase